MRFSHPGWLPAGALACLLLVWMWRVADARQHAALARFVAAHLRLQLTQSISVAKRRAQRGLFLAALALLFVALAGPLVGYRWEQINRRGNEIIFAIDTSRSMSTPDIKPNRLVRAKLAIDDFANRLDGDAVGILAFAGSAFLVCPITLDYGAFHESLGAIDTNTIPRGGTNIASAIYEAQSALRRRPGSDKILILVTDGEDLEGSALVAAQTAKQKDGLRIFTVGVGTAGGDLIPLSPDQGGGFVKDDSGAFVKSRLDESALKAIAAATGGFYVPLGTQGEGLDTIFKDVLGPLAKHDLASRQQKIYTQRYQWPLAASLGLLLTSMLIGTRRRAAARRRVTPAPPARVTAASALAAASVLTLLSLAQVTPSRAAASSDQPTEEYNKGTAAYRAGQFPLAAQAFQQSISHAPSSDAKRLADQEDAYYNLGNTLYRTGQKIEQSAPQEAIQKWTDAVKAYETALQLRPD
ncbi:MAG: Mg-chelatase subunit ChlD, partial [Gammaproteobacteria bacterium]|nr:Mg-chelatase subunit ChlD [Gammaproteobacteria bacterium]